MGIDAESLEVWFEGNRWALAHDYATALLASDWLAAHDAEVRRDTAERIAQAIEAVDPIQWALDGQFAGVTAARIARDEATS